MGEPGALVTTIEHSFPDPLRSTPISLPRLPRAEPMMANETTLYYQPFLGVFLPSASGMVFGHCPLLTFVVMLFYKRPVRSTVTPYGRRSDRLGHRLLV